MDDEVIRGWFAGRIPDGWFEGPPDVTADRDEILIVGSLKDVDAGKDASEAQLAEARSGRIKQFREDTRERRMRIAREPEPRAGVVRPARGGETGRVAEGPGAGPAGGAEGQVLWAGHERIGWGVRSR